MFLKVELLNVRLSSSLFGLEKANTTNYASHFKKERNFFLMSHQMKEQVQSPCELRIGFLLGIHVPF